MDRYLLAGAVAGCFIALAPASPAAADVRNVPQWLGLVTAVSDGPQPAPEAKPAPPKQIAAPVPAGLSDADAATLKPGEFVWHADMVRPAPVRIAVSIEKQLAFVYTGDRLIGISTVSSGKSRHETPRGTFPILEKHVEHYSNLYNNAPMPYMQRLTRDGVALHAGRIPGYPASHGCIRLPKDFAKTLFGVTGVGTVVTVA